MHPKNSSGKYVWFTIFNGCLAFVFLSAYLLVLFIILRHKELRRKSFYKLVIALGIVDCFYLIVELIYCVPLSVGAYNKAPFAVHFTVSAIALGLILSIIGLLNVIAINRYLAINFSSFYVVKFKPGNHRVVIGCILVGVGFGLFGTSFAHACGVLHPFDGHGWIYKLDPKMNRCQAAYMK